MNKKILAIVCLIGVLSCTGCSNNNGTDSALSPILQNTGTEQSASNNSQSGSVDSSISESTSGTVESSSAQQSTSSNSEVSDYSEAEALAVKFANALSSEDWDTALSLIYVPDNDRRFLKGSDLQWFFKRSELAFIAGKSFSDVNSKGSYGSEGKDTVTLTYGSKQAAIDVILDKENNAWIDFHDMYCTGATLTAAPGDTITLNDIVIDDSFECEVDEWGRAVYRLPAVPKTELTAKSAELEKKASLEKDGAGIAVSRGLTYEEWEDLANNTVLPMLNKIYQGYYKGENYSQCFTSDVNYKKMTEALDHLKDGMSPKYDLNVTKLSKLYDNEDYGQYYNKDFAIFVAKQSIHYYFGTSGYANRTRDTAFYDSIARNEAGEWQIATLCNLEFMLELD